MMNNFKRWLLIFSASFTLYEVLWFVIELQFTTFSINWAETGWDALMCMIFTSVVFGINSFFAKFRNGRYAQTVWEVAGLLLSNILMIFAVDNLLYIQDTNDDKLWSIIDIYIICLICSMFSILNFQKVYHKKLIAVKEEQLKLRLNLLQQQLSPHFMFNSLSVLQGLITIDSEKAEKYVDTLSDLMRYITQNVGKDKTTLLEAINYIETYAEMLDTRFTGHFHFEIDKQNMPNTAHIIPVSLQIAVENAIRHNRHSNHHPLTISITSDGKTLNVCNTKCLINVPDKLGVGLKNLHERYILLTGKGIEFNETMDCFTVKIPLIYESFNH